MFIVFSIFLIKADIIKAQIVINEFSSETSPDWIELYNNSDQNVNLNGWVIKDTAITSVEEITENIIIPANGFCIRQVGTRLNKSGDRILLLDKTVQKDCVSYGDGNKVFCSLQADVKVPDATTSASRVTDGNDSWVIKSPTYGYPNILTSNPGNVLLCWSPTPIPTLTPAPTPSRTGTPRPTSISTPTSTPNITSTPKPLITPSANPKKSDKPLSTEEPQEELVLGLRNELQSSSPVPTTNPETKKVFPVLPLVFISGGLICIILAGWGLFTKLHSDDYSQ
jgi:hypothetical protein